MERARRTIVAVGDRNKNFNEILGGLETGDRVVLYPSDAVSDGVRLDAVSSHATAREAFREIP